MEEQNYKSQELFKTNKDLQKRLMIAEEERMKEKAESAKLKAQFEEFQRE